MIVAGYILVDRHGNPLRGFGGRIAVYPDPNEAEKIGRVAAAIWPAALMPASVQTVELRTCS